MTLIDMLNFVANRFHNIKPINTDSDPPQIVQKRETAGRRARHCLFFHYSHGQAWLYAEAGTASVHGKHVTQRRKP